MKINKKLVMVIALMWTSAAFSQTTAFTLQDVTNQGNTTSNSITTWNKDGLNIGVDLESNYTVKTHFIRPLGAEPRVVRFDCTSNTTTGGWEFYNSSLKKSIMFIKQSSGNVGIGTTDPKAKLSVNGDIFAKRIRVTPDGWADFVFEPSYQLLSLQELDNFIRANKHLPGIPTATEVKKDGLDLGENQVKLLQKIEEMTLYLIEQHKRSQALRALINAQTELLESQGIRLHELEKKLSANQN